MYICIYIYNIYIYITRKILESTYLKNIDSDFFYLTFRFHFSFTKRKAILVNKVRFSFLIFKLEKGMVVWVHASKNHAIQIILFR